jgi:chorismate lyase/3-hydroxybenzoate synthase
MAVSVATGEGLGVIHAELDARRPLPEDTLLAVGFGDEAPQIADPRAVRVGLRPLNGRTVGELWRGSGRVQVGKAGAIRYATDNDFLAGILELDERQHKGIAATARVAYRSISQFVAGSQYRYLLRVWNILDAINRGAGDAERYRQFCVGRAAGLQDSRTGSGGLATFPAATAVGRRDGSPILQIYWLAGRVPGIAFENPRQTSAYRYPEQYGPAPPSFSRAMLVGGRSLLISGTASIVGHATHHPEDIRKQFAETVRNLRSLMEPVLEAAPSLSAEPGTRGLLKVYLRNAESSAEIAALLREQLPTDIPPLLLEADICRADLQLEIECLQNS